MRRSLVFLAPLALATGCISYSVGTTARPVAKGTFQPNLMVYFVPSGVEDVDAEGQAGASLSYSSADFEGRWGLSDQSDLGLRVPAGSGVIVNYKRLINGPNDPSRIAIATLIGAGVVNFGNHAYAEAGLIASGREDERVPYGGVRVMHVVPISAGAVHDRPTAGAFGGIRFRLGSHFSLSPEAGVYYDESALHIRRRNIVFIPSITFHWD